MSQALYSGSNFVFAVALARALSAADFGRAAAGLALVSMLVLLGRHLVLEPLLVGYARPTPRRFAGRTDSSLLVLVVAAVAAMLVSGFVLAPQGWAMAALAPVVLVQDGLRYRSFAAGRGGVAIGADVLVLVAVLPLPFLTIDLVALSAWFGVALVCSSLGMWLVLRGRAGGHELATGTPVAPVRSLLTEFALVEVPAAVLVVLLAVRSAPEAAYFRVILIPYGLFWVIVGGIRSLGLASQDERDLGRRLATARRFGRVAAGVAAGIAVATIVLPAELWRDALGQDWPTGSAMLATAAALHVVRGVGAGEILFLRGIREARRVGRVRSVASVSSWPIAGLAVVWADAEWLMLSVLLAELVVLVRLWPLSSDVGRAT